MFFEFYCSAQKTIKKPINREAENVIVEFNMIVQQELVTSNFSSEVIENSKNENAQSPTVILEEENGTLFIKSIKNSNIEKGSTPNNCSIIN